MKMHGVVMGVWASFVAGNSQDVMKMSTILKASLPQKRKSQDSLSLLPSSGDRGEQRVATEESHHSQDHQVFHRLRRRS